MSDLKYLLFYFPSLSIKSTLVSSFFVLHGAFISFTLVIIVIQRQGRSAITNCIINPEWTAPNVCIPSKHLFFSIQTNQPIFQSLVSFGTFINHWLGSHLFIIDADYSSSIFQPAIMNQSNFPGQEVTSIAYILFITTINIVILSAFFLCLRLLWLQFHNEKAKIKIYMHILFLHLQLVFLIN